MTKHARSSRKVQDTRSLWVMRGLLAMFTQKKSSQFGNPGISPFEFLSCTACWSKKQGAGMLTNNAKCIFCDNVTCFRTNKCCSNRSHLPGCFIKAPTSCLHGYSVSLQNIQGSSTCFWEAMLATRPIGLAVTIHRLPWKEFKNAPFLSLVWQLPWFFSFSGMVWRLPI